MNKFRKWLFKFVFGCDLVEYMEIFADWSKGLERSRKILELCEKVNNDSRHTMDLATEVNERCKMLIKRCDEVNANENLG